MPLFIFLLFSIPLALCRCQPSRNPLSLWILSPSSSCSSCAPVRLLSYFAYSGCRPDHRDQELAILLRWLQRLPIMSFTVPLRVDFGGKCLLHLRLSASGRLLLPGELLSFPSSPRELYRFLIGDWSTPCLRWRGVFQPSLSSRRYGNRLRVRSDLLIKGGFFWLLSPEALPLSLSLYLSLSLSLLFFLFFSS